MALNFYRENHTFSWKGKVYFTCCWLPQKGHCYLKEDSVLDTVSIQASYLSSFALHVTLFSFLEKLGNFFLVNYCHQNTYYSLAATRKKVSHEKLYTPMSN